MKPFLAALCLLLPAAAAAFDGLPGIEVVLDPDVTPPLRPQHVQQAPDSVSGANWLAPSVPEQLSRDQALIALGKGALFLPTYSEARREPDIAIFDAEGDLVTTGQPGHRVLLDAGEYEIRFGSGVSGQRLTRVGVVVEEGRTTTVFPDWSGLLVETLNETGEYIDGQYDLIRMDEWINYGRGQGYREERLQDIDIWILPPGLYRISRVGESYTSLVNYITVQLNPGELHTVEIVFNSEGSLIAGGTKTLTTRARAGRYWTYGLRAGGNLAFTRDVDEGDLTRQNILVSTDVRMRARYDKASYFGISEIFLQNSFVKEDDEALRPTRDFLQARSTWVRRLNNYVGPYVRGQMATHLFPSDVNLDTVYVISAAGDTVPRATGGTFRRQPSLFPVSFAQGAGVNVDWLSRYYAEISTQTGIAARQDLSRGDYIARPSNEYPNLYERAESAYNVGAEGVLNSRLRLSALLTVDLRAEVFAENANLGKVTLENFEADFRYFLTRNIEIGYLFQVREFSENVENRFPRTHNLSLRLSFNY